MNKYHSTRLLTSGSQQIIEPVRIVQNKFGGIKFGVVIFHFDERLRVVEPAARLDQVRDVAHVCLLREVAPPRRVVLLGRQELGPDALRAVAPRAVISGVVIDGADVPLLYNVTLGRVVGQLVLQKIVVPHVAPEHVKQNSFWLRNELKRKLKLCFINYPVLIL